VYRLIKRIIAIIAGSLAILLVLLFAITVLFSFQDFFGTAITWLLCACIIILMLFVVYITISWIVDAVKRRRFDEEQLSEKSIEKILSGQDSRPHRGAKTSKKLTRQQHAAQKRARKKAADEARATRKQAEQEDRQAAEEAARRARTASAAVALSEALQTGAPRQQALSALAEAGVEPSPALTGELPPLEAYPADQRRAIEERREAALAQNGVPV